MIAVKKTVLEIVLEQTEVNAIELRSGQQAEIFITEAIKNFLAKGVQTPTVETAV
jgi:hypothetical protein